MSSFARLRDQVQPMYSAMCMMHMHNTGCGSCKDVYGGSCQEYRVVIGQLTCSPVILPDCNPHACCSTLDQPASACITMPWSPELHGSAAPHQGGCSCHLEISGAGR